jgi:beta-D-xylosidase 4
VFEFGHGLHYTNFTASISSPPKSTYDISSLLSISPSNSTAKSFKDLTPFATVPITVSNAGSVTSDFVALGFLTGSFGPEPYPIKSLVAYTRLHDIAAGEKRSGELGLTLGNLGRVNEDGDLVLYPGDYSLIVDVDAKATWNFTLTGESRLLDEWPKRPE